MVFVNVIATVVALLVAVMVKFSRNHGVDAKSSRSEAPFLKTFFSYFISCLAFMGYELELFMNFLETHFFNKKLKMWEPKIV